MLDLSTVSLGDLVPESIRHDPQVAAAVSALDDEFRAVSALCGAPAIYAGIDAASGGVLDHLAWQFGSVSWRSEWPIELKRSVVRSLIREQAKKGTRAALAAAVASYGGAAAIKEWWEAAPRAEPHTFHLTLYAGAFAGLDGELQGAILRRVDDVKPVRSHYTWSLALAAAGSVGMAAAARPAVFRRLEMHEG